jgi:hypothetical protein
VLEGLIRFGEAGVGGFVGVSYNFFYGKYGLVILMGMLLCNSDNLVLSFLSPPQ